MVLPVKPGASKPVPLAGQPSRNLRGAQGVVPIAVKTKPIFVPMNLPPGTGMTRGSVPRGPVAAQNTGNLRLVLQKITPMAPASKVVLKSPPRANMAHKFAQVRFYGPSVCYICVQGSFMIPLIILYGSVD